MLEILSVLCSPLNFAWPDESCCHRWSLLLRPYHYLKSDIIGILWQVLCHDRPSDHPRTQQVGSRLHWRISCDRRCHVMLVCLREDVCQETVTPDDKWRDTDDARLDRANKHVVWTWGFPGLENLRSFSGEFLLVVSNSLTGVRYHHFHRACLVTYAVIRRNAERTVTRLKRFAWTQ